MYYAILLYHDVYERFLSFFLITDIFVKLPLKKKKRKKIPWGSIFCVDSRTCNSLLCCVWCVYLQCIAAQVSQALSIGP